MTTIWPLINKTEFVDIIAPSGKIEAENIPDIREYLLKLGLKPRIPENLLGQHPFSANKDDIRFTHLKNALQANDSTLIWCVRGGHGVTKLMPQITQLSKPTKQKLLVGFSDITSLHLWLNQAWQWPSLHAPMARQAATGASDTQDLQALHHLWLNGLKNYHLSDLQPLNPTAAAVTTLEGHTAGTCISLLQTSLGTPWHIDGRDKILVLEDVNEYPYRLDRLLAHLANAGVFTQAKAVIFGDLGEGANSADTETALTSVLEDFVNTFLPAQGTTLPAYRLVGLGHGKRNKPLPLGVHAQLIKNNGAWELKF